MILRENQLKRLKKELEHKKIAYFGTQIGWGKTTTVLQYLQHNKFKYEYISAKDEDWFNLLQKATEEKAEHIVIDDVHLINDKGDCLTEIIAESEYTTKFYIIGRSTLPTYLKAFYTTRMLALYDGEFFKLRVDELKELSIMYERDLTQNTIDKLLEFSKGWILGVIFCLQLMANNEFNEEIKRLSWFDMFAYFDQVLFSEFPQEIQKFLLNIGHLSEFTTKQVAMLCGQNNVEKYLSRFLSIGSFLSFTPPNHYAFLPFFHMYLKWKQKRECSLEYINRHYEITALYYALEGDVPNALKYYSLAGNDEKVSEILIDHSDRHAGNGYYYEVKDYYFSLPEEIVAKSPELMSALSLIYSLSLKVEESEYYFNMLSEFEKNTSKTDERKKVAREKVAYLKIALPHRGTVNLIDIFTDFSMFLSKEKINLQIMSITGNMPSLMNGGKDFCDWSKKDRLLYKTMKKPIYMVLGKSSYGLAEIGLGECLFEKNFDGNFTEELTLLNTGYSETEANDNIQLQFAVVAVMSRIFATQGNFQSAIEMVEKFKETVCNSENIIKNIDAFLVYLYMLKNDTEKMEHWFTLEAPDEYSDFYITERYRYLTKIKVYIVKEMYMEALSLISRVDTYFESYERTYCHMEAQILKAIVLYRTRDGTWQRVFSDVLKESESYKFIRIVSKFGVSILDMLKTAKLKISEDYREKLLENTKKQAVLYPKYMQTEKKQDFSLTETEKTVLKLICDGLSNAQISNLMEITERTVKFHLSNIYQKLNVSGRIGAINFAVEQELF
ncbi:MAG: LuxR C-terminal-related transcriptional regulator [Clostridia bacterium]